MDELTAIAIRKRDGSWTLKVWCPWCECPHFHTGGTGDAPEYGHRVAHCGDHHSPHTASGYMLVPDPFTVNQTRALERHVDDLR